MKTKIFLIAVFIFISFNFLEAGELIITPEKPVRKGIVHFDYRAENSFANNSKIMVFIYGFTEQKPMPVAYQEVMLFDPKISSFKADFKVPDDFIYALVKVGNADYIDTHQHNFWEFYVYNTQDKAYEGAFLSAAIGAMGELPDNLNKNIDFGKAYEMLSNELMLYPDNIQAQIGFTSLSFDLKKISKDEFDTKLNKIIKSKFDVNDENDVRSMSRAMRTLNKNDEAQKLEMSFAQAHPHSSLAEEQFIAGLAKAESLKEFSSGVEKFLVQFPESSQRERIFSALLSGYLQDNRYDEANTLINTFSDVPSSVYAKLALAYADVNENMTEEQAKKSLGKALDILNLAVETARKDSSKNKPEYNSTLEWELNRQYSLANVLEIQGRVLLIAGKMGDAFKSLTESKKLYGNEAIPDLYNELIECSIELYKDTLAFALANEAILQSKDDDAIDNYHKILFDTLNIKVDYIKFYDSLATQARILRLKKLEKEKINMNVSLGNVISLTGKTFQLQLQKGKVMVIDFWSTWCGPCKESLPAMDNLYSIFKDSANVVFASINVWEKEEGNDRLDVIKQFFGKSDYDLPIYIDDSNTLPYKLGITGLPTTVYIDKNGKMQFKDYGYVKDEFLRDASDKIELLLKE